MPRLLTKPNALLGALAFALAAGGISVAQRKATLTPQDYLEIQQLVSRYAYAMDSGADNGNAYADLFAPDGEFVLAAETTKGHDALAALGRSGFVDGRKPANGVSHFILNHVVEPAPGGATGKQYVVLVSIGEGGKPGGEFSSIGGHYEDRYVKTPQGWKFKRREFIPIGSERRNPGTAGAATATTRAVTATAPAQSATGPANKGDPSAAPGPTRPLTAQDYIDIRALASLYAYGLDSGAENGTGSVYANVFAGDAEFHGPPATPGGTPFNAVGREELRKFAVPGRGTGYVRHFMTNHLIEASPEGARGKVYLLVIDIGKPTSVNMGGHYEDIYVRTADGWRIRSRNFYRSKSAQTVAAEAAAASPAAVSVPFRIERLNPALDDIVSTDAPLETLGDRFALLEGPVWIPPGAAGNDGPDGFLLFSDNAANVIYKWAPNRPFSVFLEKSGFTGTDNTTVGAQTVSGRVGIFLIGSNGLALDPQNRLVVTAMNDRTVYRLEKDKSRTVLADRYNGKRFNGPNDVVVKSDGAVYFTDTPWGLRGAEKDPAREQPDGFYLIKDGKVTLLGGDQPGTLPNGITLSPDERYLYVTSGGHRTMRYDILPDDTLVNGKVFVEHGGDGMRVDRKGNVYTTGGGGGGVIQITSPEGVPLGRLHLPQFTGEPRTRVCATNLAFGDADDRGLYITACSYLFKIRLKAPGVRPGRKG